LICDDAFRDAGNERKIEEYANPYQVMYRWIQLEIQDLYAMKDCTAGIPTVEDTIK
jgi:hypothetical protein